MRNIVGSSLILGLVGVLCVTHMGTVYAQEAPPRNDLQQKIQSSAQELEKINKQIEETQNSIKETQAQSKTLTQALRSLDGNIKQLNLGIEGDKISAQKLAYEIQSLGYDLEDIGASIEDKRGAIGELLRELYERGNPNFISIFLKSGTLAGGFQEAQTLSNLTQQLSYDVNKLRDLREEYQSKLDLASEKKRAVTLHQQNLESKKFILADQRSERQELLAATKNQESLYQQNLKELLKRQQEIAAEIEKIEYELRQHIDPTLLPLPRPGVFATPVVGARLSQDYGSTSFAQYGYKGKWHNGVDFAAPVGTPIIAAEDGTVIELGNQDTYCYKGAYGKYIVIEHANNLTTLYAHLSLQSAKKGQAVKRGEVIGYVGKTGYATGPHLHFTVFAKQTFIMKPSKSCGPMPVGGDIDPQKYL